VPSIDRVTRRWIKNAADERAAANGCRFDEERGQFVVDWIHRYCVLYEGDYAGQPMELRDWQFEATMRLFGWTRLSKRWGRWIRRFNAASLWIAKKNKKSPTAAAWGLYLFAGDGEQGQKVYLAAKDGQQAKEIAGKHTVEMVRRSPELMQVCSINQNLAQVTHEPTRSVIKPISSNDTKAQKAKEGLNGSVIVDEVHVVDQEFMNRISRAGISRSEPLLIEVSTAGDDPESYGRRRYDYGKAVNESRDVQDDYFLFVAYEAPQDLSDEDLAGDPCKYGRMANPAWGHTVGEEEFLADYNRSKNSLIDLGTFKKYRLAIWQASENPWLNMAQWARCKEAFTEADLLGRRCYAGLDLARTRDTCALDLIFPDEEREGHFRQLAYYWLPRRRAEVLRDKVAYLTWANAGHIELIEGDTIDFNLVRMRLIEILKRFEVVKLAYDDTYAEQLIQRLIEEDAALSLEQVEAFSQSMRSFAGPTDEYEALIIEGKLHHNGNPVLTWQAGNTKAKVDGDGKKKPVKPKRGDHRTIDGVVAGIQALQMARAYPNPVTAGVEVW